METKHKPTNKGSTLKRSDPLKTVLNYQTTANYMTEINQQMKTTDDAVNITNELHDPCMLVMISAKKREKT